MTAWIAEVAAGATLHTETRDSWAAAKSALLDLLLAHADASVRPTMYALLGSVKPDTEWSATSAEVGASIRRPGTTHAERAHSELGASSAERWTNCPGSIAAARGRPNRNTLAAQTGTAAHEVAELCLRNGQDAIEYIGRVVNGIEIDEHTADKVQVYLDDCRTYDGPPEFAGIEMRFDLAALDPPAPMFGTADRWEYYPDTRLLKVKDYKNGWVRVPVAHNPQLKYYALGAVLELGARFPVSLIEVTICQPEHGEPKRFTYDALELAEWSAELMDAARAAMAPGAPRHAGPWCKYCPAAGDCGEQAAHNLETARLEFGAVAVAPVGEPTPPPLPDSLTPEQIGRILDRAPEFTAWLDAVRAYAAHLGGVPGWKLVETQGRSAWRDKDAAAEMLEAVYEIDPWKPREIDSPAQIRARKAAQDYAGALAVWEARGKPKGGKPTKKAAEEAARAALAPLCHRPNTGTALVPEFDSRPAIAGGGREFLAAPLPPPFDP